MIHRDPTNVNEQITTAEQILRMARSLGFALVGIAPAKASAHSDFIIQWLEAGHAGEMTYLQNNLPLRLDPAKLVPDANSIIVVADWYPANACIPHNMPIGRIARYAWGDDYHDVMKRRLHHLADTLTQQWPEHTFRSTVDTAPLLEREAAVNAGLGWVGKHTLLIHPKLGSYLLLGTIVTTCTLPQHSPNTKADVSIPMPDHCGTCKRCIDACPTQCIDDPDDTGHRSIRADACISYLTLEHRSEIEPSYFTAIGDWIAGCDVCQEVCPHNQTPNRLTTIAAPLENLPAGVQPTAYQPRNTHFDLLKMLHWTAEDRSTALRKSALKRMKLPMILRNALIAAGNRPIHELQPGQPLRERIETLAQDEQQPELVYTTARQVLAHISQRKQETTRP